MTKSKLKNKPIVRKFAYALYGLKTSLKEEKSLVIHLVIALLTFIVSGVLKISVTQWAIIVTMVGVVISSELMNTAIENTVDLISFKYNINVKKIKDIAAAATFILALAAVVVGLLIFVSRIVEMVQRGYY
ncbi:MAG: diacylglycerol kinase family protein [Ureaplasma sp.]|nr:diacylglycerol kinase family protein [Ureaplasma sp.]MDE6289679.1 diacylglycerol kinase family protein [Ureaplasma sp.]